MQKVWSYENLPRKVIVMINESTTMKMTIPWLLIPVLIMVAISVWWIPQQWQACGRLHDNILAQVICTSK